MRKFKKIMAAAAAAVMTLAMTVSAFADPAPTGTITTTDEHTYEVYQLIKADIGTDGKVSNAIWGKAGKGIEDQEVSADIISALSGTTGEANILSYVNDNVWDTTKAKTGDVTKESSLNVPTGYYLIKDVTELTEGDAANLHVIQVVSTSEFTIASKKDAPEVSKTVKENSTNSYGKTADYSIGEEIPFRLVGTLPDTENYARYSAYKYTFTDEATNMSILSDSVTVKVYAKTDDTFSNAIKTITPDTKKVTSISGGTNNKLEVGINNTKATGVAITSDQVIVVEYNAVLTGTATIGGNGNPNKVKLTYSSNPNTGGEGDTTDTPDDYAFVFTYNPVFTKVNSATNAPISGINFTLQNADGKYAKVADGKVVSWAADTDTHFDVNEYKIVTDANGKIDVKGLDVGTYTLTEALTEAQLGNYLQLAPFTFTITAEIVANPTQIATNPLDDYVVKNDFAITASNTTAVDLNKAVKTNTEGENTTYTLIGANADPTNGTVNAVIKNTPKSSLPTTGGIGTKLFYIVGGAMMFAAAALLVVKKLRRNA